MTPLAPTTLPRLGSYAKVSVRENDGGGDGSRGLVDTSAGRE